MSEARFNRPEKLHADICILKETVTPPINILLVRDPF
jgi:hypothetical protein